MVFTPNPIEGWFLTSFYAVLWRFGNPHRRLTIFDPTLNVHRKTVICKTPAETKHKHTQTHPSPVFVLSPFIFTSFVCVLAYYI